MTALALPIATMAAALNIAGINLGCERDVIRELNRAGFAPQDILAGLELAIDRARSERAADSPLKMAADAIAAIAVVACVWLWAGPIMS